MLISALLRMLCGPSQVSVYQFGPLTVWV